MRLQLSGHIRAIARIVRHEVKDAGVVRKTVTRKRDHYEIIGRRRTQPVRAAEPSDRRWDGRAAGQRLEGGKYVRLRRGRFLRGGTTSLDVGNEPDHRDVFELPAA